MKEIHYDEICIEKLKFSMRTYNCLKRNNINTIQELLEITEDELKRFRNLGTKSLEEIKMRISKLTSGEFVVSDPLNINNKMTTITEFTILDMIDHRDKKILKVLFYDENKGYADDIRINDMNLSVRSLNALINSGYKYASQLIELKLDLFNEIKNLGQKSKEEIISNLKSLVSIVYNDENTKEIELIKNLCNALLIDYEHSLVEYDLGVLKTNIYMIIKGNCEIVNDNIETFEELINNNQFLDRIYNNNFLIHLLKSHIFRILKETKCPLELSKIEESLPKHLMHSNILKDIINNLTIAKQIEQIEDKYRIWYVTLDEYIKSLENEREKLILYNRFQGKTLEETGIQLGLTRERVRQLEKKAINRIPRVREDDYNEIFQKYNWTPELFEYCYNVSDIIYGYLKIKYDKGKITPEFLLDDNDIPIQVRLRVENIILKDYIIIGSSRIKKNRYELLDYVLRNYCKDEVTSNDLSNLYYMLLEDYKLDNDNDMIYPNRYFETTLAQSKKVLWKYGKKLRYYDFSEMDAQRMVESLNLNQFENVEYSTLKFFIDYIDIMEEWDIRDEYELHNLMKKVFSHDNVYNITLARMPNIEFGKPDRDMQVLDILLQTAPIENYELAKMYEKEYGIKSETVLANYFKCIDEYYHNGIYSIDNEALLGNEFEKMKNALVKDIYFIKDVRAIYVRLFPEGNSKLINSYNLKRLGFRVSSSMIYSDKYTSLELYFRTMILRSDIYDTEFLDSRLTCSHNYYHALQNLKGEFEIIEFLPNKFVNIRRLRKKGIEKVKLQEFIDDVYEFVDEELFTITSLRQKGFTHKLDELGFDDWFYSDLLRCDSRFKHRRVGRNILLRKGTATVTLNDLVEHVVCRYRSIDIYDLIEHISNKYGIIIDRYKIPYIAKDKELFYDPIMEKVYIDYDEYFEEV